MQANNNTTYSQEKEYWGEYSEGEFSDGEYSGGEFSEEDITEELVDPTPKNIKKMVLIGDGGVGKTAFAAQARNVGFTNRYIATIGVEVRPVTNSDIQFMVWDCAGQEKFGGLRDGYYIGADCCVAMFSLDSRSSFKNINKWLIDFRRVCPNAPIILCGNKSDEQRKVPQEKINNLSEKLKIPYLQVSVKNNTNILVPFANFARAIADGENQSTFFNNFNGDILLEKTIEDLFQKDNVSSISDIFETERETRNFMFEEQSGPSLSEINSIFTFAK